MGLAAYGCRGGDMFSAGSTVRLRSGFVALVVGAVRASASRLRNRA